LYEKPEYDEDVFSEAKPRKLSGHKYTLANILKYGGVCHDRAIFASEVGKAAGAPSVYIRGMSSAGIGHAWVGYLKRRGRRGYEWDLDSGRMGGEEVTVGEVLEPQSCIWVSEHELNLALRAMALSKSDRAEARMWLDIARLLAQAGVKEEKAKRAAAAAMRLSLSGGVFDKSQWRVYAQLGAAGVFSADEIERAIGKFSADLKDDPPLAVDAFAALLGALDKTESERKLRQFDKMVKRFRGNELVAARVRLVEGQWLETLRRSREAEKVYARAAVNAMRCGRYGLALLDNAARLMLERRGRGDAISLHRKAYDRTPRLGDNAYIIFATRFRVGLRLAKLYRLNRSRRGEREHDRALKNLLSACKGGGSERRRALFERYSSLMYGELNRTSRPVTD